MCLRFHTKSTERNVPFEIRVGPLFENVDSINGVEVYLTVDVYDEKQPDPELLCPHFCFSDSDFKIKLVERR